jgi:hypothetical protein
MIDTGKLTSVLVPYQLPEFIRDNPDYSNFVLFLQAYYEWLEETGNVTDRAKNLLNYKNIDKTTEEFNQYFYKDFLQYFPIEILANKNEVLKVAKQLYQAKGTPASFQFFFKTLYGSDVDFFNTKDAVLKASSGKWYVAKSLKLATKDANFLETKNLRAFGETTKSIATIENVVEAQNKMEVFISNIERLFQSGEMIRIVDNNNQDVYFLNGKIVPKGTPNSEALRAKLVGQISQIKISPTPALRGSKYKGANTATGYPGDPIVIYGGLNSNTGHGASATVATTTKGSIKSITVTSGGFGYTPEDSTQNAYSIINISGNAGVVANLTVSGDVVPIVTVGNSRYNQISTVTNIPIDRLGSKSAAIPSAANSTYLFDTANGFILHAGLSLGVTANATSYTWNGTTKYLFANNANANATTKLANAFTFVNFTAYPISSVSVLNQGGGLEDTPTISASSLYKTADGLSLGDLGSLGILGPISIDNPGKGYSANDKINFYGGSGYGAYANVTTVDGNGSITNVAYVYSTTTSYQYPLGGLGYRLDGLPTINVANSLVTGANVANLSIKGILGQSASFTAVPDRVGSITTINISDYGEDYINTPNVSFKVQDIVVTNIALDNQPKRGDLLYQGTSYANATYTSKVDSLITLKNYLDPTQDLYTLRVYDYTSTPNIALPIKANNKTYSMTITDDYKSILLTEYGGVNEKRYANGVINYGGDIAQGTVSFLNGLTIGQGQYLDTTGQPSSFDVLQSTNFNNYTYQITLEKEIEKYRSALLNLLHPTGMKVRGRFAMKSNSMFLSSGVSALRGGHTLSNLTGTNDVYAVITTANYIQDLMDAGTTIDKQIDALNAGEVSPDDLLLVSPSITSFSGGSSNTVAFYNLFTGNSIADFISTNNTVLLTNANGESIYSEVIAVNPYLNTITLKDTVWLSLPNVANGSVIAGGNTINISKVYTSSYNSINNGIYTDANNPLIDIVHTSDYILINNETKLITGIDYINKIISISGTFSNSATGNLSLQRVLNIPSTSIKVYGPVGLQYEAQLSDENGNVIITEDGNTILIN